jgi:hypothetical protein
MSLSDSREELKKHLAAMWLKKIRLKKINISYIIRKQGEIIWFIQ